ncbi:bifunctional oligoribonuclease/PAP phosphatase NrnA [Flavobacteriaceae bacterium F08102]|nr:bifunctional oligoribonuclease/PAP phosphatase NrnA [Flavobacteriaceae bacterium F08102]
MKMNDLQQVKQWLAEPKNIAIVSHRNPDGDAYGSSLALFHLLKNMGHTVHVVSPNDCPDFLKWLPGQDEIVVFEQDQQHAEKLLHKADLIFTLDFNALHRVGDQMEKALNACSGMFLMIDHHEQPDDYAAYTLSDPTYSSTCELLYQFIERIGELERINTDIATCLYTGIVTDTGSFKYAATDAQTHLTAAALMKYDIQHSIIHNKIFDSNSVQRLQLLGKALQNLTELPAYHTAYISLSQNELNNFNYKKGDTEGFVNYALSLANVVFAVIFIEDQKQGIIKMSFRSKGNFSVNEFARKNFNGGGHHNAAGGKSEDSLSATIEKFKELLPLYKNELHAANV